MLNLSFMSITLATTKKVVKVVHGRQLGRTMDCPTINQELSEHICIPK